jgi:hypothetical protein
MSTITAFQPMGKTFVLVGNSTNQTVTVSADSPVSQYLFVSHEVASTGQPVYVRISPTSGNAAAVPNAASGNYGIPIRPGSDIVLTGPNSTGNVYISFLTATGTANVYVTPGEGL